MDRKFLLCRKCGNLIEMINDSGITPFCCGKDMNVLTANTTDGASEKHVPVITINNNIATVTVGETLHPMEDNHYIAWIYLKTTSGTKRVDLNPGEEPIATFALLEDEKVLEAYAYCNLHGLWVSSKE